MCGETREASRRGGGEGGRGQKDVLTPSTSHPWHPPPTTAMFSDFLPSTPRPSPLHCLNLRAKCLPVLHSRSECLLQTHQVPHCFHTLSPSDSHCFKVILSDSRYQIQLGLDPRALAAKGSSRAGTVMVAGKGCMKLDTSSLSNYLQTGHILLTARDIHTYPLVAISHICSITLT